MQISKVCDNGGVTCDRYTVFFVDEPLVLDINRWCDTPTGYSEFCRSTHDALKDEDLGSEIPFKCLPRNVRKHIEQAMAFLPSVAKAQTLTDEQQVARAEYLRDKDL